MGISGASGITSSVKSMVSSSLETEVCSWPSPLLCRTIVKFVAAKCLRFGVRNLLDAIENEFLEIESR